MSVVYFQYKNRLDIRANVSCSLVIPSSSCFAILRIYYCLFSKDIITVRLRSLVPCAVCYVNIFNVIMFPL